MANVVHFNMIVELNQLLKSKGIEYSLHSVGGCTCCGLELKQNGKSYPEEEIIQIINVYLDTKWLKVICDDDFHMLNVISKFE